MKQTFPVHGTLAIDADTKTFTLTGSLDDGPAPPDPPVPPTPSGDAIDLQMAVITSQSPDVRGWPIGAKLTALMLNPGQSDGDHSDVNFSKRNGPEAWPIVMGPEGEIQYTLWIGCQILGIWYLCGAILCISRGPSDNYCPTGPVLKPDHLPANWYYFAGSPLAGYQPRPGELVAWFVTAGVQRRNDIHQIAERSNVVLVPFSPGTFTF